MKKIIIVSDSFKGTLSSLDICAIARETVARVFPDCTLAAIPVADGGEGTVDCFLDALGAERVTVRVSDPFGGRVDAAYARKGGLAVVETASAAGLPLAAGRENPETATTHGVGELIRHAVGHGCTKVLLGLGGSCTNDGGCGCAAALGTRFYDADGNVFVPTGGTLGRIARIDNSETEALLRNVLVTLLSDVTNPLYGELGAARVFAPQKGADKAMTARLDAGLRAFDAALRREPGVSVADVPGAGAAGGMGAGCMALLGAELRSGIETMLELVGFDAQLEEADLVITGEGHIDAQSLRGKVVSGVAKRARAKNVPLVVIAGAVAPEAAGAYDLGVTAMFGIDRGARAFADYAAESAAYYRATLEDVLRLIRAFDKP